MKQSIKRKGFTLVELVIVIAVIAILAAVLIPTFVGVIDNANNSADVQLAANLNTALADAQVYPDEVASAQNIRKHVKPFGYEADDLVTKKSDNVLAWNKNQSRMEVLNVSKISADQLVPSYYAEEVISGYIIVSTGGNDLSEALYKLSNLPKESDAASLALTRSQISPVASTPVQSIGNYVKDALNGIKNSDICSMVTSVVQSTLFVNPDGNMYFIDVTDDGVTANKIDTVPTYSLNSDTWELPIRSRVAFSEGLESFDVKPFMQARTALAVIVPTTVTITNSYTGSYDDLPTFSGNVGAIPSEKVVSVSTTKEIFGSTLAEGLYDDYAEKTVLYNADQIYTSDLKNDLTTTLAMAKKIHDLDPEKVIRLVVNGQVTLTGAETIPEYVDMQIPFALGNNEARKIMEFEQGDALGGKPLGSAYPANDNTNLTAPDADKKYYLCGEGPGGGTDWGLSSVTTNPEALAIFKPSKNISTNASEYCLTVGTNATLNVAGNLTIGAVVGYPDASGYQGHTSGAYGYITNNGTIRVNEGGVLDVWGFIKGTGEVIADSGSIVFEPFVVPDYVDTVPTLWLYPFVGTGSKVLSLSGSGSDIDLSKVAFNSPFMRYNVMNIQTQCTLNYGSALYGRANLIVFGGFLYCRTDAPLVTSDNYVYDTYTKQYKTVEQLLEEGYTNESDGVFTKGTGEEKQTIYSNGAFVLSNGSSVVSNYSDKGVTLKETNCEDYEKADPANKASLAGDIGVNTITIHGNIETYGIRMNLLGGASNMNSSSMASVLAMLNPLAVDTSLCTLPVSYHFNFKVASDGCLTIGNGNKYALLPGSSFEVEKNGKVIIEEGSALYGLDSLTTSEFYQSFDDIMNIMNNATSKTPDENGIYNVGDFIILPITIVRKYYPSAKMLSDNGFSVSAKITVNGTLEVKAGGDIGGTVDSTQSGAKINLATGAGMGKLLNLGGPYDVNSLFFSTLAGMSGSYDGNDTPEANEFLALMSLLTTTYHPCYLRVIDKDGQEIDLSDNYDSVTEDFTSLQTRITNNESLQTYYGAKLSAVETSRTANKAFALNMGEVGKTYTLTSAPIVYFALSGSEFKDATELSLVRKVKIENPGTAYNGGWAVA